MSIKSLSMLQRLAALLLIVSLSFTPGGLCFAQPVQGNQPNKGRVKINIGKLQHEIKIHLDKIRQSGEKEVSVLDELDQINTELQLQNDKLTALQKRLVAQKKILTLKEEELKQATVKRDNIEQHMRKRLRSFYLMGKVGALNVTFSNKDLPELMVFTDAYQRLIAYDQKVIDLYRETVAKLERTKTARKLEKSLLEEFISQKEQEQKTLQQLRDDRQELLTRIKTQKGLYELAVQEMRKAETDLEQTLAQLEFREKVEQRGFLIAKGTLPTPATGTVTQRFGDVIQDGLRKGETVKGITIKTDPDSTVHAIYGGTVVFSGYKRGYGNTVIIEHGLNYFTVTSHLDTILVNKGDRVEQDQQLGTTGDIATLFEPGLYFEIRHESQPLNPLQWLQVGIPQSPFDPPPPDPMLGPL
jgi:septal ring factor EnvC (AmiA/AmiB activator)